MDRYSHYLSEIHRKYPSLVNPEMSFGADGGQFLERVAFYSGTFGLQEALHGFENDDQEAFENSLEEYRY